MSCVTISVISYGIVMMIEMLDKTITIKVCQWMSEGLILGMLFKSSESRL